ncbi:hypothetical protein FUAX_51840 (plasmid) [Fulvitalea axinellae]|uniref:HMA domain-containing protein n=1 Tax=Fulvitalea axinellae TaxID=1182444 RepID=A0AAU9D0S2_9BACT|nr:hypothetical protein FUAX_51840 [Fulvitalea axinellae]
MATLKFKTTLMCSGCVSKVQGPLDKMEGVQNWTVDTDSADKTLTVEVDNPEVGEKVTEAVKKFGFECEPA